PPTRSPPGCRPAALNCLTRKSTVLVSPAVFGARPSNASDESVFTSWEMRLVSNFGGVAAWAAATAESRASTRVFFFTQQSRWLGQGIADAAGDTRQKRG